jgi:hypothetical protein
MSATAADESIGASPGIDSRNNHEFADERAATNITLRDGINVPGHFN